MQPEPLAIPLTVENLSGEAIERWPVTSGVPFPAGALRPGEGLALSQGEAPLPLQWEPLSHWPDGSVKWALLDFQAGAPAGERAGFVVSQAAPAAAPSEVVRAWKRDGRVVVDTGRLRLVLVETGFRLFDEVAVRGAGGGWQSVARAAPDCAGLGVRDAHGARYTGAGRPVRITIEQRGPLRATVAVHGEHVSRSGKRCFSFVLRIHAYAGLDFVKVEHRILNDNPTGNFTSVREVALEIDLVGTLAGLRVGGLGANRIFDFRFSIFDCRTAPALRLSQGDMAPPALGDVAALDNQTEQPIPGRGSAPDAATPSANQKSKIENRKSDFRLFQEDHRCFTATGAAGSVEGARAPGWLTAASDGGCLTVAVRDFWQQWPKSLEVEGSRVRVGLFPTLEPGQYAGREPLEKHYYLFQGRNYRLKTGVAKSHEVWFRFTPEPADERAFQAAVQTPPVAVPEPAWAAESGAWGDLAPAGQPGAEEYDAAASVSFERVREADDAEEVYGVLNWGDWFGERQFNWGNNEYDSAHALFLQFARTGDARAFHAARRFARHMADVDILHAFNEDYLNNGEIQRGYGLPVNVGAVYLHALGHVAGYFPLQWAKRRWPKSYYYGDIHNLGHLWNEGMLENYYLTGDPWAKEAALQVADHLVAISRVEGMTWWFGKDPHCGRVAGWPLTALCAAYNATGKRDYLRAARHIVEHALADQDPHCGGWIYSLYPGHCYCRRGHVGMATFITAVLLNGLALYHQITGDERVARSIVRAVDYVISDSWVEKSAEFHYTSCPASAVRTDPLMLRGIAYAWRLSGSPRQEEVLRRAWARVLERVLAEPKRGASAVVGFAWVHREMPRALVDVLRSQAGEEQPPQS